MISRRPLKVAEFEAKGLRRANREKVLHVRNPRFFELELRPRCNGFS